MRLPGTAASLSSRMSSMSLSSGIASVGTNTGMLAKECSSQTNARGATASYRAVGLGMHQSQPLLTAIAPDLDPMVHGPKPLTARYASSFGYENSGAFCPVILHMRLIILQFACLLSASLLFYLQPQPQPPMHHTQQFPSPMPPPPHALGRVSSRTFEFENSPPPPPPCPGSGPIAMSNGTIQLRLREGVR